MLKEVHFILSYQDQLAIGETETPASPPLFYLEHPWDPSLTYLIKWNLFKFGLLQDYER